MRKQEQEALRRLEAALMEQEHTDQIPTEEYAHSEDIWQELSDTDYDVDYEVYNTDAADVDLDEYSEEVHQGNHKNPFLTVALIFSLLLLVFSVLVLMNFLGVI